MTLISRNLTQAQVDLLDNLSGVNSGDEVEEYTNLASFPVTGVDEIVYIDKGANNLYRWDGAAYVLLGADAAPVDSVNGETGVVVLDADDIDDTSTTHKFVTATDLNNLSNLSGTNSGDVTLAVDSTTNDTIDLSGQELTVNLVTLTTDGAMSSVDKTKLDGIETSATADQNANEVPYTPTGNTSSTDVQSAITELQGDIDSLNTASHSAVTLAVDSTTNDTIDLSGQDITVNLVTPTTDGAMSSADKDKLDTIETNAKDDQNSSEVPYSNTVSGLTATNAQAAIDEIDSRIDTIESASGEQNTASNVGTGEGVFKQKTGLDLEFKSIKSGDPLITVNSNPNEVTLDFDSTDLDLNTAARHDALTLDTDLDTTGQAATLVNQELELKKATASTDGVMSSEDKTKLDAVESGATADQNASEVPFTPTGNTTSTDVQSAIEELQTELDAQTDDQDATEVDYDNTASGLTAITVQAAIDELENEIDSTQTDITNLQTDSHIAATLGGVVGDTTDDTLDLVGQTLTVNLATTISDGAMSAADKLKLDGVATGAEVNVQSDWDSVSGDNFILNKPTTITAQQSADITTNNAKVSNVTTNLSIGTITGTTVDIDSSDGTDATIPSATATEAGLMSAADKVILDGITDTDDQVASEVGVTPSGNLSSTDVQAALQELQGDIDGLSGATDELVKVTANDTVGGYLYDKIIGTTNKIIITEVNDGADEDLKINIGVDVFDTTVNDTDDITEGAVNKFASASAIQKLESIKAGEIAAGSFTGNPKIYDVVFATAYPDTQYIVTTNAITSNDTDKYVTNVSNKTTTGFKISLGTGSISNLLAVEWYTIKIGE